MAKSFSQIPWNWFECRNGLCRFITYWGDIYTGTLRECHGYTEGFFIMPNSSLRDIKNLEATGHSPEKYRDLGIEIKDYRVITDFYRIDFNIQEYNKNYGPTISSSGQEFKEMFVFGAGASAHCCFDDHKERYERDKWRSPLGYDIFSERFEDLCKDFKGVKQAIPEFEIKNNTIEECLESDWLKYSSTFEPELAIRNINIQFYLQRLFRIISEHTVNSYYRKNLYQLFANQLRSATARKPNFLPVIVNFNYDTILDQFIDSSFGYKTLDVDDYIDWKNRRVAHFKPHGSCNWGWKFPKKSLEKLGSNVASSLYEDKILPSDLYYNILGNYREMVNEYSYGYEFNGVQMGKHSLDKLQIELVKDEPAYPAILLPFKEKDEFVMPYHHQTALNFVMNDIERLFVVGWKGSEQLFLNELRGAKGIREVVIVNPDFDNVKLHLQEHIKNDCTWTHVENFETFIKNEMI